MARHSLFEHTTRTEVPVPHPEVTMREERRWEWTKSHLCWLALYTIKKKLIKKWFIRRNPKKWQNDNNSSSFWFQKSIISGLTLRSCCSCELEGDSGNSGAASLPLPKDTGSPARRGVRMGLRGLWDGRRRRRRQRVGFCSPTRSAVERSAGVRRSDTESLLMMSPE